MTALLQKFEFKEEYLLTLRAAEQECRMVRSLPIRPRTFQESDKSKKTIDSMVERTTNRYFSLGSSKPSEPAGSKKSKKQGES